MPPDRVEVDLGEMTGKEPIFESYNRVGLSVNKVKTHLRDMIKETIYRMRNVWDAIRHSYRRADFRTA